MSTEKQIEASRRMKRLHRERTERKNTAEQLLREALDRLDTLADAGEATIQDDHTRERIRVFLVGGAR